MKRNAKIKKQISKIMSKIKISASPAVARQALQDFDQEFPDPEMHILKEAETIKLVIVKVGGGLSHV